MGKTWKDGRSFKNEGKARKLSNKKFNKNNNLEKSDFEHSSSAKQKYDFSATDE